jgi:F0F1-type ATP synthase assembly protein I
MKDALASGMRYAAIGFEFSAIVVVTIVIGYHVDRWLGTAPLFMLLFSAGGLVGALRRLLWSLKRDTSNADSP